MAGNTIVTPVTEPGDVPSKDNGAGAPVPSTQESARRAVNPPRYATGREITGLALVGAVVGILLLASLVAVFPAATAATSENAVVVSIPLLFGLFHVTLDPDATLMLLVVLASAVGSFVHVATSFANYAGRNRLETSWLSWYALRCLIGAALATVFYFVVRAGFFSGDASNASVNAYGIAAVAGFVGLFSRQATDKLRELFDTLFKTDSSEEEVDPVLLTVSPNPVTLDGGAVALTLEGSGFVRLSQVRIDGRPVTPTMIGPSQIRVDVPPSHLREAGTAEVTVLNPGPCAESDPFFLTVLAAPSSD
jgi:IPT/TIG domain